LSECIK
jgi:hypothetical protein